MCVIASMFVAAQAYSAPKEDNGKAKNEKSNNGKSEEAKANNGNNKSSAQSAGQAEVHKQQARRANEAQQKREARNRFVQHDPALKNDNNNHPSKINRVNIAKRSGEEMRDERAARGIDLVEALNRARWSYNPHDTRGQGNMGKPDMLDPFGHDKDSDRKELYGNNGRPIRVNEEGEELQDGAEEPAQAEAPAAEDAAEVPEIVEGLPAEEEVLVEEPVLEEPLSEDLLALAGTTLNIDFSLLGADQEVWLADWFQRTLDWYYTSGSFQASYTYEQWYSMWEHHFYPGGTGDSVTGIRIGYNDELDYTISADGWSGDSLEVTTTLVASEDYTVYDFVYNAETGTWTVQLVTISAGDVLSETTQTVVLDPETGSYIVAAETDDEGIPSQQNIAYFVDMEVTVTDTTTGTTATTTYDQSLYLYRCPYGKITDNRSGQAIVGAKVTVHFEDGSIVALDKASNPTASNPQVTDATGRFGFKLQTNRKYYMTAKAEGYEDYKSPVFTEQWHVLREDIQMVPKTEQMAASVK